MSSDASHHERLFDLLSRQATEGLSPEERQELDHVLMLEPSVEADGLERAAAAIELALGVSDGESMPAHVRDELMRRATDWAVPADCLAGGDARGSGIIAKLYKYRVPLLGAASLAIAAGVWMSLSNDEQPIQLHAQVADMISMIDTVPDTQRVIWSDEMNTGIDGNVVWSNSEQRGYVRVRNLPNDELAGPRYDIHVFTAGSTAPVHAGTIDFRLDYITDCGGYLIADFATHDPLPVVNRITLVNARSKAESSTGGEPYASAVLSK